MTEKQARPESRRMAPCRRCGLWIVAALAPGVGRGKGFEPLTTTPLQPFRPRNPPALASVDIGGPLHFEGPVLGYFAEFAPLPKAELKAATRTPADTIGCSPYRFALDAPPPPFVVVARRGNCTFVRKARLAQQVGAGAIVIVSDTDQLIMMSGEDPTGEAQEVDIPMLCVQNMIGEAIIEWDVNHSLAEALPVVISVVALPTGFWRYWDTAAAIQVVGATALVAAGACVSTADLRKGSLFAPKREEVVVVGSGMAIGFCFMGSCTLLVMFYLMKYTIYVMIFGFCVGGASATLFLSSALLMHCFPALRRQIATLPEVGHVTIADVIAAIPSVGLVIGWLVLRNSRYGFIFQDLIGSGFLCMMQRSLRLPNLKIATLLLSSMFFFDIYWVFLSPYLFSKSVMMEVARGGDTGEAVPMLFRVPNMDSKFGGERLLGFGDIALPGLLVSYLLRYDTYAGKRISNGYFVPSLVGYFFGLVATIVALHLMNSGQPALLYLVPLTLWTTLCLGVCRGELVDMWKGPLPSEDPHDSDGAPETLELSMPKLSWSTMTKLGNAVDDGTWLRNR